MTRRRAVIGGARISDDVSPRESYRVRRERVTVPFVGRYDHRSDADRNQPVPVAAFETITTADIRISPSDRRRTRFGSISAVFPGIRPKNRHPVKLTRQERPRTMGKEGKSFSGPAGEVEDQASTQAVPFKNYSSRKEGASYGRTE